MRKLLPGKDNTDSSKEFEEAFFNEISNINSSKEKKLEDHLKELEESIGLLKEQYNEGEFELASIIDNNVADFRNTEAELIRQVKEDSKPYFGRIIYDDTSLYIGKHCIKRGPTEILVTDWRAPISNAYYETRMGEITFRVPKGNDVTINVTLKRTFDIDNNKLVDYFDSEATTNDDLLNKYLAKNKQAVLSEIIATIQKEQNDIIRLSPKQNLIVQGVAGSGKTTVAMHRISFLLYNYEDILRPQDFFIIGSNKMLLKYITGVLPELGVNGFGMMTMEEFFTQLLDSHWDDFHYCVKETDSSDPASAFKGTGAFFKALKDYCDNYENRHFKTDDVMLDPNKFNPKNEKAPDTPEPEVCIFRGSAIKLYIKDHPNVSMQVKIKTLNDELLDNLNYYLSTTGKLYKKKKTEAIRRAFYSYFGAQKFKDSIFAFYDDFISTFDNSEKIRPRIRYDEMPVTAPTAGGATTATVKRTAYDVYDLAALSYIHHRLDETEPFRLAKHIVVDEAQDYGMMAYNALKECIYDCKYTIMGDVSQNIRYSSGLNDWKDLRELFLTRENDSFLMLRKSYRNTIEISDFAMEILKHGSFEIYPCEPIIRHGDEPQVIKEAPSEIINKIIDLCKEYHEEELGSIAIVCRDKEEADALKDKLSGSLNLVNTDEESGEYAQGIMVLPVNLTKGLEFDAVILYEPTPEKYPVDNSHVKLLYVAATRAMHKLCILYSDKLSELFKKTDSGSQATFFAEEKRPNLPTIEELRKAEEEKSRFIAAEAEKEKKLIIESAGKRTGQYLAKRSTIPAQKEPAPAVSKVQTKPTYTGGFLKEVSPELLKPSGHALGGFATKWIHKKNDGIYFQSQNGIIRFRPINANIVRISYSKGVALNIPASPAFKDYPLNKDFQYKETPQEVQITLKNMSVRFDKYRGAFTFLNSRKATILKEKQSEARFFDDKKSPSITYTFFEGTSSDVFYILNPDDGKLNYLSGKALYSNDGKHVPCIIKKEKYAIIPLTTSKSAFCHMPVVGTFMFSEDAFSDYYLIVDEDTDRLVESYRVICGLN